MAYTTAEFECIYKRCFNKAMGLAVKMLYDEEDARDTVQQVFVNLWESGIKIENPDAYIYRSIRNACLNRITKANIHERVKKLYSLEMQTTEDIDHRIVLVEEAVAGLTDRQQQVVREVFSKGNTYRVAAENLNLSVASINKYVVSALKILRMQLINNKS